MAIILTLWKWRQRIKSSKTVLANSKFEVNPGHLKLLCSLMYIKASVLNDERVQLLVNLAGFQKLMDL